MTTAFLNALKTKSAALQTQLEQPKQIKPIASIPMPQMVQDLNKLITSVNVVANRNRIDVLFNRKPDQEILDSLKENGFRYNPTTRAWYHQDNKFNRTYLALFFGADFPIEETEYSDFNENTADSNDPDPDFSQSVTLTATTNDADQPSVPISYQPKDSPNFERYKDQVNKLSEHYTIDPVDLMMLAIDALYTRTFNYN